MFLAPVFGASVVSKTGGVQTGDYSFDYPSVTAVEPKGFIDSNNSTTTPLASGATFVGTATEILDIGTIFVVVYSDVDSAADGLVAEMSSDGTYWDINDTYTVMAARGKPFHVPPAGRYFRVRYTNGALPQTAFRLSVAMKGSACIPSAHRIADAIIADDDAVLTKSVLTGMTPSGTFTNVNVTSDGNLAISDNSSGLAISEGLVTGKAFVHKFGEAPDFDTVDGVVTIWDGANDAGVNQMRYVYSTTAAIDSISSSNAADTNEILVQGLDASYTLVTQMVTLTGQIRAPLDTPLIRVFRLKNNGTTDLAGYAYVYENTTLSGGVPVDTTKVRAIIQNGYNQTLMAVYTIPAGKTGYLRKWYASTAGASKTSSYIIQLRAREYDETLSTHKAFQLKHIASVADGGSTFIQHDYVDPERFAEKTDIEMRVESTAAGATGAAFAAGFDIVLVDNN